ncbi:MAG TPA: GNAT family N-acetyltransferase [Frankiaceae bacterium]|nr:GNAT family N-acetyltransferase [Frankiaceae bacterium]
MDYSWRASVADSELDALHVETFGSTAAVPWNDLLQRLALGWATAREGGALAGFAAVYWDGRTHAWLQDVMVASAYRRHGVGSRMVATARDAARDAGCAWLHVDFGADLAPFYLGACGFAPTAAGLLRL